ncbi:hypothetical protein C1H76_6240 [Elsinoe australis]|uniref:Apple domain-containing protein n=1 Tax=Elsinoe australis TaxID=40998 RepID=A0A4U7B109_9PEZI|nr:hypothetical protein C1H76_6240 [Elsinoe australis]
MKTTILLALAFLQSTHLQCSSCRCLSHFTPSTTTTSTLTDSVYKFTTTPTVIVPPAKTFYNTQNVTVWNTAATPSTIVSIVNQTVTKKTIINAWTSVDCRTTYSHTTQVTLPAATISTPAAFRPATSAMYATTKALSKLNRRAVATPARKDVNVATVTCTMLTVMVAPASTSMQPDVTQTSTRTVYQTPPRLTIISSNVETRTVPTTAYFESCTAKGVFQTTITLATVTPSPSVFACGANNLLDGVARVTSNPGKASSYILGPVVGLTYADGVNKINSQGPTNAADCCKACWTDSTCLGSAWLQPEGRCGVFRTSSGKVAAGQSTSAGMFYDMQNTRVGFAKTEHYFNGSSLVLSNGPAGFWGDASGYV